MGDHPVDALVRGQARGLEDDVRIERPIADLGKRLTIVLVTHNLAPARRLADRTAFFHLGKLVEVDATSTIVVSPKEKLTENYVTGPFG